MEEFALKGNILFTPQQNEIVAFPNAYTICHEGICNTHSGVLGWIASFSNG